MNVSPVTSSELQFPFPALNPKEATSTSAYRATRKMTRRVPTYHYPPHRSMAEMICRMDSTIESALRSGKLTDDRADEMKKELDSITELLRFVTQT